MADFDDGGYGGRVLCRFCAGGGGWAQLYQCVEFFAAGGFVCGGYAGVYNHAAAQGICV